MKKVFNLLVRDNIPDKIKNNVEETIIRIVDDIITIADQKRMKRGGFEKRIFFEKTL